LSKAFNSEKPVFENVLKGTPARYSPPKIYNSHPIELNVVKSRLWKISPKCHYLQQDNTITIRTLPENRANSIKHIPANPFVSHCVWPQGYLPETQVD